VLGTGAACRELGATRVRAALAALGTLLCPAVLGYIGSGYVDPLGLAGFAIAWSLCLVGNRGHLGAWPLAAAALALSAGTKLTFAPLLGLLLLTASWTLWRDTRRSRSLRIRTIALCAGPIAVAIIPYVLTWVAQGNPLYPFHFEAFGRTLSEGDPLLRAILSGATAPGAEDSLPKFLSALFLPTLENPHLNFSVFVVFLVPASGATLWTLRSQRGSRASLAFALLSAGLFVATILSSNAFAQRAVFADTAGRLLTPIVLVLAVLSSVSPLRSAAPVLGAWVGSCVALSSVSWISDPEWSALRQLAFVAAPIIGAGVYAESWTARHRTTSWRSSIAIGAACALIFVTWCRSTHHEYRSDIYRAAASGDSRHGARLDERWAGAWPLWAALDGDSPRRIACTAGWNAGHIWYRYPLIGSRQQNTVLYVPPTRSGDLSARQCGGDVDLDVDTWLARLESERVDHVVIYPARSITGGWIEQRPERFELVSQSADGTARAYHFRAKTAEP
ncbi:MAG: hypothetical protein AAF488_12875, partial [Planctomycetota bacterium]